MGYTGIIRTEQLINKLGNRDLTIVDCRYNPRDTSWGERQYRESHIPGAIYVHLYHDLSGIRTGLNGRHPLPEPQSVIDLLVKKGITTEKHIVAYDDSGCNYASRFWWTLKWLGYQSVAVLDGGWSKWLNEDLPTSNKMYEQDILTSGMTQPLSPGHDAYFVGSDFIETHLGRGDICLIDARSPETFSGRDEWQDPLAGHIPGAINHYYKNNLCEDGTFKSAAELYMIYSNLISVADKQSIIHSCGSGVNACCNILSMEIAGLSGSRLYPGSWSEWCSDRTRPMITPAWL